MKPLCGQGAGTSPRPTKRKKVLQAQSPTPVTKAPRLLLSQALRRRRFSSSAALVAIAGAAPFLGKNRRWLGSVLFLAASRCSPSRIPTQKSPFSETLPEGGGCASPPPHTKACPRPLPHLCPVLTDLEPHRAPPRFWSPPSTRCSPVGRGEVPPPPPPYSFFPCRGNRCRCRRERKRRRGGRGPSEPLPKRR